MAKKTQIVDKVEDLVFLVAKTMRYDTGGDWNDREEITVYEGFDEVERLAIGIHELIEMVLLHLQGVTDKDVLAWDTKDGKVAFNESMYEKDKRYKEAHRIAEKIEKKIIEKSGRSWKEYAKRYLEMEIPNTLKTK